MSLTIDAVVPKEAQRRPPPHQNAHIWDSCRITGVSRIVDCQGSQQAWTLLLQSRAQDGSLRCLHKCSPGPSYDHYSSENVRWADQLESEDHADCRVQSDRKPTCRDSSSSVSILILHTGLSHPKRRLFDLNGRHRRRPHIPSDPGHSSRRLHARHEGLVDYVATCPGICSGIPATRDVGAFLQLHWVRDWNVYQRTHQEEETAGFEEEVSG